MGSGKVVSGGGRGQLMNRKELAICSQYEWVVTKVYGVTTVVVPLGGGGDST